MKNLLLLALLLIPFSGCLAQSVETDSLEMFVQKYQETWQLHDAGRLAKFFTDDSDMIVGVQPIIVGRDAIETFWDQYFSRIDSGRIVSVSIESKRLLSPTIALLNINTTTSGTRSGTNETMESRKARGTWVVTRSAGDWRIAALRMHSPVGEQRLRPGTDK